MAALDADPTVATAALAGDPLLGTLMSARRGLRVPGTWDPFEVGVRAIVGQQVSVAGATTVPGRIVERHGPVVAAQAWRGLHRAFPSAAIHVLPALSGPGPQGLAAPTAP